MILSSEAECLAHMRTVHQQEVRIMTIDQMDQ